ncbi:Actin-depolymerizing factor domain [Trinorchestia longiramus]|nr:Actin-depolymerizing factor domain [Trinorchestia longiramus]
MSFEVCSISSEVKEQLQKFRFRRDTSNTAIILKVDPRAQTVVIEEELTDLADVAELRDLIPDTQPRYVLLSWRICHSDGRVSFPMAFLFTTPRDCEPKLQMMYSGSYNHLIAECGLTKVFQMRDLDELNEEWLTAHLA